MPKPNFEDIKTGEEFNQWYWLKEELVEICKRSGLPIHGRKFDLRDRIMFALDNDGKIKPEPKKRKVKSKFNWSKSKLTKDTRITDNVSFGPNFRNFMANHIGGKFRCHGDFMDWVKSNEGKTLKDAIQQWNILEMRKDNPDFKLDIAENNMYSQYIRDFLDDNPNYAFKDVKKYWLLKKELPMKNGFVKYEKSDITLGEE
nr:DUF6434 domain-containing protein [uncultured Allomuricauda sp.]